MLRSLRVMGDGLVRIGVRFEESSDMSLRAELHAAITELDRRESGRGTGRAPKVAL